MNAYWFLLPLLASPTIAFMFRGPRQLNINELFFGKAKALRRKKVALEKEIAELQIEKELIEKEKQRDILKHEVAEARYNGRASPRLVREQPAAKLPRTSAPRPLKKVIIDEPRTSAARDAETEIPKGS